MYRLSPLGIMNKFTILITIFILAFTPIVNAHTSLPESFDDALKLLDKAIENKDQYVIERYNRADSMKQLLSENDTDENIYLYEKIGDEYRRCNIDSALLYYQKGIIRSGIIGDSVTHQKLILLRNSILPVKGIVKEAVDGYDSIGKNLYPQNRTHFFEAGNNLFYFASSFYPSELASRYYGQRIQLATDSLVANLPPTSLDVKLYNAQLYYEKGNPALMVAEIRDLLMEAKIEDHLFAKGASHLADYFATQSGKEEEMLYYLTLASLSDIRSGTLEGTALEKLGEALYKRGDVDRAYEYLVLSLDKAVASGSRIRAMETAEVYPLVAESYRTRDKARLTLLLCLVVALCIALSVIVLNGILLRKRMRKMHALKASLAQSNITKDIYISKFLSLSSIYIEKLEDFHRVVKRKLKANQTADLYTLIESGSMLEEQSQMFYKIFDNAFINIYPTFVEDVNALLVPEKRFNLPENKLNTELRILAFLRLGIDESEQIARFLGLSLNTIYTYRNKLKSKAKNRDTFDESVMKIGVID